MMNQRLTGNMNISYEQCHMLWEKEETKVHKDVSDKLMSEIAEHIVNRLDLNAEDSLLTIGCGDGYIDRFLIPRVKHFYAIDFSKQKLEEARKRNPSGMYFQKNFLESYKDIFKGKRINKIYSYSVMQYCHPEDINKFFVHQLECLDKEVPCMIAHLDVPEISKAKETGDKNYLVWKENGVYDMDGSYWHDLKKESEIIKDIEGVKKIDIVDAHYWYNRSDMIVEVERV